MGRGILAPLRASIEVFQREVAAQRRGVVKLQRHQRHQFSTAVI